jgi:hypothetical protein
MRTGGSTPSARLSGAALLVLASAAAAAAIAFTAWHLLPYELLERDSPNQRFHLWEATMWMGGMALALFGLAAWLGSTDLYGRTADPHSPHSTAHVRRRILDGIRGRHLYRGSRVPSLVHDGLRYRAGGDRRRGMSRTVDRTGPLSLGFANGRQRQRRQASGRGGARCLLTARPSDAHRTPTGVRPRRAGRGGNHHEWEG